MDPVKINTARTDLHIPNHKYAGNVTASQMFHKSSNTDLSTTDILKFLTGEKSVTETKSGSF